MDASNSTSDSRDASNIIRQQKHSPASTEPEATAPPTAEMLATAGRPTPALQGRQQSLVFTEITKNCIKTAKKFHEEDKKQV
jgi:hypothetical protein